jgi:hypothetical protein
LTAREFAVVHEQVKWMLVMVTFFADGLQGGTHLV